MRHVIAVGIILATVPAIARGHAAEPAGCYRDWSAASVVVRSEGLVTLDQLVDRASVEFGGEIVRTTLCRHNTGYVYRLVVRDAAGHIRGVTVDAKRPFDR